MVSSRLRRFQSPSLLLQGLALYWSLLDALILGEQNATGVIPKIPQLLMSDTFHSALLVLAFQLVAHAHRPVSLCFFEGKTFLGPNVVQNVWYWRPRLRGVLTVSDSSTPPTGRLLPAPSRPHSCAIHVDSLHASRLDLLVQRAPLL